MSNVLIPHGDFIASTYVGLTAKFFGGEITDQNHTQSLGVNADVVNWQRGQLYESKATHRYDRHMMRHEQMRDYEEASKRSYPIDGPEAFYFFWEHDVRPVDGKSREELEVELIKSTKSLLVLSFDLIMRGKELFGEANPSIWDPYTPLKATTRRRFAENPEAELQSLGANPANYEIIIRRVEGKRFKRRVISPFNLMIVQPKRWRGLELIC